MVKGLSGPLIEMVKGMCLEPAKLEIMFGGYLEMDEPYYVWYPTSTFIYLI